MEKMFAPPPLEKILGAPLMAATAPRLELQLLLKIHYRHRTGTTRMRINTSMYKCQHLRTTDRGSLPANLPAFALLAAYTEFFTSGALPATSSYIPPTTAGNEKYRHAGSVVMKLCISSCGVPLSAAELRAGWFRARAAVLAARLQARHSARSGSIALPRPNREAQIAARRRV